MAQPLASGVPPFSGEPLEGHVEPGRLSVRSAAFPARVSSFVGRWQFWISLQGGGNPSPPPRQDEGPSVVVTGSDRDVPKLDTGLHSCHSCNTLTRFSVDKMHAVRLLALSSQRLNLMQFLGAGGATEKKTKKKHLEYILV